MYDLIAFCKWCQDLPLPDMAKNLKELGLDGVDLPCRPSAPITHANGPEKLPEAKKVFEDHGLRLERLVTSLLEANAETERLLETIHELGIKKIRVDCGSMDSSRLGADFSEAINIARKKLAALAGLLEKHQVKGGFQNHSGIGLGVNLSSCLLMLQDLDPEWIGVQYDPGHCMISGESIEMGVGMLGPYLHSVNLKNSRQEYFFDRETGQLAFKPIWVPLWDGMLNIPKLLKLLWEAGYRDPLSIHAEHRTHYCRIENHLEAINPIVGEDVAYLRRVMQEMDA